MFKTIRGKRVLITGASTGIGACTAELFALYGATVGIHYNASENEAKTLKNRMKSHAPVPVMIKADLTDSIERNRVVETFVEKAGGIDILINNAGSVIGPGNFLILDEAAWDKTIDLNLKATFFLSRDAFSRMKDQNDGRIISISSIAAKYGGSASSIHYGAAKAGVEAVTRTLAREGARYNILVNAIQPGVIDTGFHKKIGRADLTDRSRSIPLGRAGTPLDVARLCLFLASEAGDYITGQIYGVTGGD